VWGKPIPMSYTSNMHFTASSAGISQAVVNDIADTYLYDP
jgi:hypothetical protein